MARDKERLGWRLFWRYQGGVFQEAGWPPVRTWIGSLMVAAVTGSFGKAMSGDWSWFAPIAAGFAAGILFYAIDLERAAARLHVRLQKRLEEINQGKIVDVNAQAFFSPKREYPGRQEPRVYRTSFIFGLIT